MKAIQVGTNELMDAFGVSRQTISNMVDQGMPKLSRGEFDLNACWQWRLARKDEEVRQRLDNMDLEEQETRYKRAQADLKELELAVRRGELIELDKVTEANGRAVSAFRAKILSGPVKLAPRVLAARDVNEVKAILDEDAWEALHELSVLTSGIADKGSDTKTSAGAVADHRPAAKTHGKRVGRQPKSPKSGGKRRARKLENRPS